MRKQSFCWMCLNFRDLTVENIQQYSLSTKPMVSMNLPAFSKKRCVCVFETISYIIISVFNVGFRCWQIVFERRTWRSTGRTGTLLRIVFLCYSLVSVVPKGNVTSDVRNSRTCPSVTATATATRKSRPARQARRPPPTGSWWRPWRPRRWYPSWTSVAATASWYRPKRRPNRLVRRFDTAQTVKHWKLLYRTVYRTGTLPRDGRQRLSVHIARQIQQCRNHKGIVTTEVIRRFNAIKTQFNGPTLFYYSAFWHSILEFNVRRSDKFYKCIRQSIALIGVTLISSYDVVVINERFVHTYYTRIYL